MLKLNYIRVIIPQQFDFKLYNINTDEEKQIFLQKMCEDAINKPIIQDNKIIGVITDSKISKTGEGIITGGKIWCSSEHEITKDENGYSFSSALVKLK